jgi:hypothetical protein
MERVTRSDAVLHPLGRHASCTCVQRVYGGMTWLAPRKNKGLQLYAEDHTLGRRSAFVS